MKLLNDFLVTRRCGGERKWRMDRNGGMQGAVAISQSRIQRAELLASLPSAPQEIVVGILDVSNIFLHDDEVKI